MNRKQKLVLLSATVCFCMGSLWSEESRETASGKTLSVEDAVRMALQTHVDIQRSALSLEQVSRNYKHSWNSFLPSLSADGTGEKKRSYKDSDSNKLSIETGINASLTVDPGIGDKIRELESEYEAGQTSYEDTVRSVEFTVRKNFYELLYLKEKLENSRTTLASYQRQYDQTLRKWNKGVATELDLLSSQVNVESAKPDVDSALSTYNNTLREFLDTIGLDYQGDVELAGTLDYSSSVQSIDQSVLDGCVEKSADVRELEDSLRTAELSLKSNYYSQFFPSLTFGASVYPGEYTYDQKADTDSSTPYWDISLGVSLPLDCWVPGSSARDKVAGLGDTVKDYKVQLADKKKTVRTSAVAKLHDIELSLSTLQARTANVQLAKKTYEMTEDAYQRGTKDLLTLQAALDSLHSAELNLYSEQYNLITYVLDLEKALALPAETFFTNKEETKK
jgi:outer membrane protein